MVKGYRWLISRIKLLFSLLTYGVGGTLFTVIFIGIGGFFLWGVLSWIFTSMGWFLVVAGTVTLLCLFGSYIKGEMTEEDPKKENKDEDITRHIL